MNTNGDISGTPSMQPTQHLRTSPQGLRVSEHMPRRPSCVCLLECSFSRANLAGAPEARKTLVEVALTGGVEDQTGFLVGLACVSYFADQLTDDRPYFPGASALNDTPGGDRWARVLGGQIG